MTREDRDALILSQLPRCMEWAKVWSRRVNWGHNTQAFSADDFYQQAALAVVQTAEKYEPSLGTFEHFVARRIIGSMKDMLRHASQYRGCRNSNFSTESVDPASFEFKPVAPEYPSELAWSVARLTGRQRTIFERQIGGYRQVDVAHQMGISEARVSQITAKGIAKLKAMAAGAR